MNVSYHYLTEFYEFAVLEAKTVGYWQLHVIRPVYCYWFNFETRTTLLFLFQYPAIARLA